MFFALIFSIFFLNTAVAEAITVEELRAQILKLQTQIAELEKQIAEVQLKSTLWCHNFMIDLKHREKNEEVRALQIALEKEGLFKWSATGYFGPITFQAVKLFQEKYQKEILEPWGFKKGTGFVGPTTRTKLNELYGCTKVSISSLFPQQGDTVVIKIKTDLPPEKVKGSLNSKKINFSKIAGDLIGIVGISAKEKAGKYNLLINFPDGSQYANILNIVERKFPVTELVVTKELEEKGFTPSKIVENITTKENLILKEILSIYTPKAYFDQSFIYPLEKIKDVGAFGNIRKSGEITLQHLGVDLEADIGNSVYAINDGVVRFSQELTTYGKTIIIDHGLGIFSLYLHLDEFKVFEGKTVKRGEIVALSGNTGYSIAPHLHWGVKISGASVDPLRFIKTTEKELPKEGVALKIINRILKWGHHTPPTPRLIDTIIIHSSYDALGDNPYSVDGVIQEYKLYGVSSHYLISRDGIIYCLAPDEDIAYHAGISKMPDGRTNVNDFSIGIELIYTKTDSPKEIQYQSLVQLVKYLQQKYNIQNKNILGHKDITPERKTDPWNFDWKKFIKMLK
ncbi:MAG: peptidoglycan DD-metalloendopeptidase family protein [Patescibacteria group bacterium]|nr:peptidoglycan DD-metalloendopeptidase family protein [Patescibacteria group bacterium]